MHVVADALGSVSVLISCILIKIFHLNFLDPLCSMGIAFLIIYSAMPILISSFSLLTHVLDKEGIKKKEKIEREIAGLPIKLSIIKSEMWFLTSKQPVFELRIHIEQNDTEDITITTLGKGESSEDYLKPLETEINERIRQVLRDNKVREAYIDFISINK